MSYSIISKPGAAFGPCKKTCIHIDCAEMRRLAKEQICPLCSKPIGYESKYTRNDDRAFVHWVCLVESIEKPAAKATGQAVTK